MNKFLADKIDSDLKILTYQCDEFISKNPGVSEYFAFCKNYYHFLKVLNSINWKNPEICETIQKFPVLEIPPLTLSSVLVFTVFSLAGVLLHSIFFFLFFIILPLLFLTILIQKSVLKNYKSQLIKIIQVSADLRRKILS